MKQPWQQQQQQQQQQRQRQMAGYAWEQEQKRKSGGGPPERRGCLARLGSAIGILLFIAICALIVYVALNFQGPSF